MRATRLHTDERVERGATLIEVMISLAILLVGLLGMAKLQIFGMSATEGARAQTIATQLAAELATAIERLDASDDRLSGSAGADANTPPAIFGRLLPLGVPPTTEVHVWNDAAPIPGARLDSTIEHDPENPTNPFYQRRWTVWDAGTVANGTAAKIVAVSVIWRERTIATPREVVLYVHSEIRGNFMANINAFD